MLHLLVLLTGYLYTFVATDTSFNGTWPNAHSFSVVFDVPERMRHVRAVESLKAREAVGQRSFASYEQLLVAVAGRNRICVYE